MPRVHLTDRFVASSRPIKGGQTEYFDDGVKGLALRVGARERAWTYHFTSPRDGKRARVTLGSYPAQPLAAARAKAIEARGHVEDGRDPRDVFADEAAGAMTVSVLIGSYLAKHVKPNLRTAAAIDRRLGKNVVPVIGRVRVGELHRRDVNRVLDPILARGRQIEAGRVFEDMRALFRWALARGDVDHSPMEGMRKPNGSAPRDRVLSDDEIHTLWHGLPVALRRSKACQRIIRLCLVTGQRVGEVAGMTRGELDLEARLWRLPGARTKNGRAHTVPLSDLAISIIKEALADAGEEATVVFPCGDGSLPPHAVARTIGRAQETSERYPHGRFGMSPRWTAHDLRRTMISNLARLGVPPIVAGAIANHTSVTRATITLSVYTHYSYEREKRQALDQWADHLETILAGTGGEVVPLRAVAGR